MACMSSIWMGARNMEIINHITIQMMLHGAMSMVIWALYLTCLIDDEINTLLSCNFHKWQQYQLHKHALILFWGQIQRHPLVHCYHVKQNIGYWLNICLPVSQILFYFLLPQFFSEHLTEAFTHWCNGQPTLLILLSHFDDPASVGTYCLIPGELIQDSLCPPSC